MDLIFNPNKFFYDLVAIFANMIDVAVDVCNKICGIPGEDGSNLVQNLFETNIIVYIFMALLIIAGLFGLVIAMAETMHIKSEEGVSVLSPYADYAKGMAWMFGVSAAFPLVIVLVGAIGGLIQGGLGGKLSLGTTILQNCFDTSKLLPNNASDWQNLWSSGVPSWEALNTANRTVAGTFNAWVGILGIGVITFPLIGIVVYMAKRLINILMLYAISPISFGLYARDGGVAKNEWLKDMKGALIGGVVVMIVLQIFLMLSSNIMGLNFTGQENNVIDMIYKMLILGVGSGTILTVTKNVLKYFGCDDQLLATAGQFTAGRALGAVKRGLRSVKDRIKGRKSNGAVKGNADGGADTEMSEQARLQAVAQKVAYMRKQAIADRQAKEPPKYSSGQILGGKTMNAGTKIDRETNVSKMTKGKIYSKPELGKPTKKGETEAKGEYAASKAKGAAAAAGVNKGNNRDNEKVKVKDLKPVKVEVKIKDGKLARAMEKLGKSIEKKVGITSEAKTKPNKENKKVAALKITQTKSGSGFNKPTVNKISAPLKKTFKVSNKMVSSSTINNRVDGAAQTDNSDLMRIKHELSLNRQRMQSIIEGQNKNNRRTQNLQASLRKLSRKTK